MFDVRPAVGSRADQAPLPLVMACTRSTTSSLLELITSSALEGMGTDGKVIRD